MPKKSTLRRAREDKRQGKAASTQAGEFVREEIEEIRAGKHGARSAKQARRARSSKAMWRLGQRETAGPIFLKRPQHFPFPGATCLAGRVVAFVVCDAVAA